MAAYTINKDVKYGFLNVIDVNRISADVKEKWFNQTFVRSTTASFDLASFRVNFTGITTTRRTSSSSWCRASCSSTWKRKRSSLRRIRDSQFLMA